MQEISTSLLQMSATLSSTRGAARTIAATESDAHKSADMTKHRSDKTFGSMGARTGSERTSVLHNATLYERFRNEIQFEVNPQHGRTPLKSKILLVTMQALVIPSFCGLDRCYMGQPTLGLLKFLTLSGFCVWGAVDYFAILVNSLLKEPSIDSVGFVAEFSADTINNAFFISCSMCVLFGCIVCMWCSLFTVAAILPADFEGVSKGRRT